MDASIYVATAVLRLPEGQPAAPPPHELGGLLRQVLEVQREQLGVLKAQQAAADSLSRWKAFLARWSGEYPGVGSACKEVLPILERAYLGMIQELTDKLRDDDFEAGNEFVLTEFLDRYGVRLGQLGTILSQLGPIADAAPVEADPPK